MSISIFEDARNTNFAPYLRNRFPDQIDSVGYNYTYVIPDTIFVDDDGNETLTLSVKLSNGQNLPDFLEFNSNIISGILNETKTYSIRVTATDKEGASISDIFKLTVINETTAIDDIDNIPKPCKSNNSNNDKWNVARKLNLSITQFKW